MTHVIWKQTLTELELQMTKATFNTWLKDAKFISHKNGILTISVRNEYARDWLEHRLKSTITKTYSTLCEEEVTLNILITSDERKPPTPPPDPNTPPSAAIGFPRIKSNWTPTPDLYFEILARPDVLPTTKVFIGQIIFQTRGNINKLGNAPEWWENVGYADITAVTGIRHRKSLAQAIAEAINNQWAKRRPAKQNRYNFDYALRYSWDPLNEPIQAPLFTK